MKIKKGFKKIASVADNSGKTDNFGGILGEATNENWFCCFHIIFLFLHSQNINHGKYYIYICR